MLAIVQRWGTDYTYEQRHLGDGMPIRYKWEKNARVFWLFHSVDSL